MAWARRARTSRSRVGRSASGMTTSARTTPPTPMAAKAIPVATRRHRWSDRLSRVTVPAPFDRASGRGPLALIRQQEAQEIERLVRGRARRRVPRSWRVGQQQVPAIVLTGHQQQRHRQSGLLALAKFRVFPRQTLVEIDEKDRLRWLYSQAGRSLDQAEAEAVGARGDRRMAGVVLPLDGQDAGESIVHGEAELRGRRLLAARERLE